LLTQQGIRAVVESIYEPPQIGDSNSVQELIDKDYETVDRIAIALRLEVVGWFAYNLGYLQV
jgi:hypothetical protein